MMLGQDPRKTPDFVKGVVEWGRGDANDVRFAKIAFNPGGLQFAEQFFRMLVRQDRQLTAALICFAGRDDGEVVRTGLLKQKLEVAG